MKGGPIDLVMGDNLQASNSSEGGLDQLPLNCLGTILSFLTPREVEIAAYVCRSFREASKWNFVWEKMLPPRYEQLAALDPAFDATRFRDLREFYFHLCQFSLFANSTKGFWLDRNTGGACLGIGARGLDITWGNDLRYWKLTTKEDSLFPEVAQLESVCWFEVKGEIQCSLPPGDYTLSWRLFLVEAYSWESEPVHFTLSKDGLQHIESKCYLTELPGEVPGFRVPTKRQLDDGWVEYDVGEFTVGSDEKNCAVRFAMVAIEKLYWKYGICLDGAVIRPTNLKAATRVNDDEQTVHEAEQMRCQQDIPEYC